MEIKINKYILRYLIFSFISIISVYILSKTITDFFSLITHISIFLLIFNIILVFIIFSTGEKMMYLLSMKGFLGNLIIKDIKFLLLGFPITFESLVTIVFIIIAISEIAIIKRAHSINIFLISMFVTSKIVAIVSIVRYFLNIIKKY